MLTVSQALRSCCLASLRAASSCPLRHFLDSQHSLLSLLPNPQRELQAQQLWIWTQQQYLGLGATQQKQRWFCSHMQKCSSWGIVSLWSSDHGWTVPILPQGPLGTEQQPAVRLPHPSSDSRPVLTQVSTVCSCRGGSQSEPTYSKQRSGSPNQQRKHSWREESRESNTRIKKNIRSSVTTSV